MSLSSPLWLLALLLLPVGVWAHRRWRARGRRYALRFTAVAAVRAALGEATAAERWWRRVPVALLLLALGLGIVGLAGPRVSYRKPVGNGEIVLVLDHSGSMASSDVAPSRIAAAIKAGNTFINEVPANVRIGFVGFGFTPDAVQRPSADHSLARALLDQQNAGGGTDTGPALQLALRELGAQKRHHPPAAIVLLSDGAANLGVDPVTVAATARREHVPIDTVALGTPDGVLEQPGPLGGVEQVPVPPDPALMRAIAATSGGSAFDAKTSDELSSIYKHLGDKLGSVTRQRPVAAWWLAAAALLLGLALLVRIRGAIRLP